MRPAVTSLRGRLTLLGALVMAAMLAVAALALVTVQRGDLVTAIDEGLRQRVENVQADVAGGATTAVRGTDDAEDTFVQLLDARGDVLAASRNLAGRPAVAGPVAPRTADAVGTRRVPAVSSSEFRVLARGIASRRGPLTLVVGKNLDDVAESTHVLTRSLLEVCPPIVAVLALLLWWLTGRTLRPVEQLRTEVDRMGGDDLARRVPVPATDDEIARLARTMNAMLERLERAGGQQRRFAADASHEMRGPLTRLRAELELALAEPGGVGAERFRRLLADTVELQTLVEDLLFLARSDGRPGVPAAAPVDLDDLVLAEARRLRGEGRVSVDTSGVGPARVRGEAGHLARALRNLTSNAARHARSTVYLGSAEVGGQCRVVVADDGPGIPAEQRDAVFERFVRLDEARARDTGGSGLGLAIVKEIVTRHEGSVGVSDSDAGGARFTITLPRD